MAHELCVDDPSTRLDVARHQGLLARLDQPDSELTRRAQRMKGSRLGDYFELLLTTWMHEIPEAHVVNKSSK